MSREAIPALKKIGVSEQAIRTMTVDMPRRFLEAKQPSQNARL